MTELYKFKVGDVVRLKSEGMNMTVFAVVRGATPDTPDEIKTGWFDVHSQLMRGTFPEQTIALVEKNDAGD